MAFDDAPSRGGGGFGDREIRRAVAQPGAGVSGGGLARGSSSRAPASYQNAGASAWTTVCGRVEEELRRFATLTSTLKKNVDTLGTPRDSEDVRTKITAAVARGKEAVTDISGLLKTNLAEAGATDDAALSQMERTARKTQQQRFEKDWMAASAAYKETLTAWQEKARKFPLPPKANAGKGGQKGGGGAFGSSSLSAKAEEEAALKMQLVNFEEQLVEEREDAIVDIAHAISEVNETFRDLAAIVEEQGKNIDMIDNNTTSAQANTADGVDQLTQAEKHQKGYRKWIVIMLLLIILGGGGIAAAIIVQEKNKGGK